MHLFYPARYAGSMIKHCDSDMGGYLHITDILTAGKQDDSTRFYPHNSSDLGFGTVHEKKNDCKPQKGTYMTYFDSKRHLFLIRFIFLHIAG